MGYKILKDSRRYDTGRSVFLCQYQFKSSLGVIEKLNISLNHNHYPPLKNRDFTTTKDLGDPRPVCKLEFVRCGPVEKNQSALSASVQSWRTDKVREHLFPNSDFRRFRRIFIKIPEFSKNSQRMSLKARGLKFWNLALHIHI